MMDLGGRIRELRMAKGLSQAQLSARLGVSKAMISAYELSTRQPSYEVLRKLACIFGVSTDYLLDMKHHNVIEIDGLSSRQTAIIAGLIDEFRLLETD